MTTSVTLQCYYWKVEDKFEDGKMEIHCWGLTPDSEPVLVRLKNFPCFFRIELPLYRNGDRRKRINWTKNLAGRLKDEIQKVLGKIEIKGSFLRKLKKLYYYQNDNLYPFLTLMFGSMQDMYNAASILRYKKYYGDVFKFMEFNIYELEFSPVRKLLTHVKLRMSDWFTVSSTLANETTRVSNIKLEYIGEWGTIKAVPVEECKSWVAYPRILAFDIECYSDRHKAMPNKCHAKHVAYMISCVFQVRGRKETRKRIGIIYGDCNDIPESVLSDLELIRTNSEYEMIEAFCNVVVKYDPEIITGYNIYGFDYPYLDQRLILQHKTWPCMGRLAGYPCVKDKKKWKSNAYSFNDVTIIDMPGRISVDLFPVIRRNNKFDVYDLDFVSNKILGKRKHDVKAEEMFKIYERLMKAKESLCETEESIKEYEAAKAEMTRVMAYCIQDSELVIDLFDTINIWYDLVEQSSIVGVSMVELYSSGQQKRCYSQLYDEATRSGFVINERNVPSSKKVKGATVFDPVVGLHENVICLDFASLYPSIIQAFNFCYTTLVHPALVDKIDKSKCHIVKIEQEEEVDEGNESDSETSSEDENEEEVKSKRTTKKKETTVVSYEHCFVKQEVQEGLVPKIVRNLVKERREVRARIKYAETEIEKEILGSRQLALKTSANAFYGFLGVREGGKKSLIEAAMSVTAKGRELIDIVQNHVTKKYGGRLIYGDTDSIMVDLNISNPKECHKMGRILSEEITAMFPPPLAMEYEKTMRILCLKKKKYSAVLLNKMSEYIVDPNRLMNKGNVVARRDNCKLLRDTYNKILVMILSRAPFLDAIEILFDTIERLIECKVELSELVVVKCLGSNYKSESNALRIFAEDLRKAGKIVNAGDRLKYVVVKNEEKLLGHKMRLFEDFDPMKDEIDLNYYLEKIMKNPFEQLFNVGYMEDMKKLKDKITFRPSKRSKVINFTNIVGLIQKAYFVSGIKPEIIKKEIQKHYQKKRCVFLLKK